ncbi:alkaline phosphatase family protein [Actinoplanes sp. RD1]|uniref:alkaline phosphatase family protein n=1 Tax=Actinoplanes sp. RD1 TaxID=3064538 RepID=UPI0027404213|nr:nucleotide pyrophosphatase/phosphodiesterase family protein [Actinoplanes sp. RD1]
MSPSPSGFERSGLVRPAYGHGSLAEVLPSVAAVLGVPGAVDALGLGAVLGDVDRVAVLLVDGLGAYQLPSVTAHAPILGQLGDRTITSGFPSTTPVSLATIGTGVPPGEHGIVGFTVRQESGEVLNHIQWGHHPDPVAWQPVPTWFERLRAAGVGATLVTRPSFRGTGLTVACYRGASFAGAADVSSLATAMLAALSSPGLVYGYHPDLDHHGHGTGVGSPEWAAAAGALEELVSRLVAGLPPRSALLITADHGQVNIPFDARPDVSDISGDLVGVAGEPRVRYLHTAPGAASDVADAFRSSLGASARVMVRDEAIASGLFGPVSPPHAARIGDVVVLCVEDIVLTARDWEPPSVGKLVAYHGSVTAAEMTVPLLISVVPPI